MKPVKQAKQRKKIAKAKKVKKVKAAQEVPFISTDPDIQGTFPAMQRAAKRAWALSKATGTPFYIYRDGQIVDLNAAAQKRKRPPRKPIKHLEAGF